MQLLRNRRFALLVTGQAVNGIGSWCALIAMWGYGVYHFDAGPGQVMLIGLSWSLPAALLGPLAGLPVDRMGPRRVLMISDTAAAGVAIALSFAGSFATLVALGLLLGVTKAFAAPAFHALPPRLVDDEQLPEANALLGSAAQSSIAFGPLLAAGSIAAFGLRSAFLIDAVTYLVGVAVVVPLGLEPLPTAACTGVRAELREGFAVVRARPGLLVLLALSTSVYIAWGAYAVVEPIYVRDVLHRSATTFALLQMAFGLCLLTSGLCVARWGRGLARLSALAGVALVTGFAAGLYIGTPYVVGAFLGVSAWGALTALFVVPSKTLLQRLAPIETHGRLLALDSALQSWAHVVAISVVGVLATGVSIQVAGLCAALVPTTGGFVVLGRHRRSEAVEADAVFAAKVA